MREGVLLLPVPMAAQSIGKEIRRANARTVVGHEHENDVRATVNGFEDRAGHAEHFIVGVWRIEDLDLSHRVSTGSRCGTIGTGESLCSGSGASVCFGSGLRGAIGVGRGSTAGRRSISSSRRQPNASSRISR